MNAWLAEAERIDKRRIRDGRVPFGFDTARLKKARACWQLTARQQPRFSPTGT
jgi:hypothetical protein